MSSPLMRKLRQCALLMLLLCAGAVTAQAIEPLPFKDRAEELRFQRLTAQLRCPMCQNETLADSNAPIAHDLRGQIFQLMRHGQSDAEIKQYLAARYSNYVLYSPPLAPYTWLLWFGPLLILLAGAGMVVVTIRTRARIDANTPISAARIAPPHAPPDDGDDW